MGRGIALRVLQVIPSLAIGGAEVLVSTLADPFRELGLDIHFWLFTEEGSPLERQMTEAGFTAFYSGCNRRYHPNQVFRLATHFKKYNYDIIHAHLFPPLWMVPIARRMARTTSKLVFTEHSTSNSRRRAMFRPIERWVYSQYDRVVCISEGVRNALEEWIGNHRGGFEVIHNGIPLDRFANVDPLPRTELIGTEEATIVLMVASFREQKDHRTVVYATRTLPDVHLVFVGRGPLEQSIKDLVRSLGMEHRVHFLGQRNDVERVMASADIYVQSSLSEGFGIAALEAMASGLPTIASDVPGLAEVVGDAGLLFPAGNAEQLALLIRKLQTDRQLRETLRLRARQRAASLSIESTAYRYVELYKALIRK